MERWHVLEVTKSEIIVVDINDIIRKAPVNKRSWFVTKSLIHLTVDLINAKYYSIRSFVSDFLYRMFKFTWHHFFYFLKIYI